MKKTGCRTQKIKGKGEMVLGAPNGLFSLVLLTSYFLFLTSYFSGGFASAEEMGTSTAVPEITAIEIEDNVVKVSVNGSISYKVYKADDPFRAVVDIEGVRVGNFTNKIVSDKAGITEITPMQVESPQLVARLDILLSSPSDIRSEIKSNTLVLKIEDFNPEGKTTAAVTDNKAEELVSDVPKDQTVTGGTAREITQLLFDKVDDSITFIIKGNGLLPEPAVFKRDQQVIIDIPGVVMKASLPSHIPYPIKDVSPVVEKDKVRFITKFEGNYNAEAFALDDEIVINFAPNENGQRPTEETKVEAPIKENVVVKEAPSSKNRVSLDFQDADIVAVLRLLSDVSGYNMVIHPAVTGKVSMKLSNVPWEQALDSILRTYGLAKSVEGNIITIAPQSVYDKEKDDVEKGQIANRRAEPLITRVFHINYADIYSVEDAITKSKILSERGTIGSTPTPARDQITTDTVDKFLTAQVTETAAQGMSGGAGVGTHETLYRKRNGLLIITDVAETFPKVEKLLAVLDKPTPQILIEVRIVELNRQYEQDLGVQWGVSYNSSNSLLSVGPPNQLTGSNQFIFDNPAQPSTNVPPGSATGLFGVGSGMTFGLLNPAGTLSLDLKLSALEQATKGRIISTPRILTTQDQKARILQGQSIPYISSISSSGSGTGSGVIGTTSFKDVAISLHVTPHVTSDNKVTLSVVALKEDLIDFINIGSGTTAPRTSKIEGNTRVTVENGGTFVIGGILEKTETNTSQGTPGLMSIPVLGWLFKNRSIQEQTQEMIIFITPRIVPDEAQSQARIISE